MEIETIGWKTFAIGNIEKGERMCVTIFNSFMEYNKEFNAIDGGNSFNKGFFNDYKICHTDDKKKVNVKIGDRIPWYGGCLIQYYYLVATAPIKSGEEILFKYDILAES